VLKTELRKLYGEPKNEVALEAAPASQE